MDTNVASDTRAEGRRGPRWIGFTIGVIPVLSAVVGVGGIVYGLLRFLRGDESLVPIFWTIVLPIGVVPAALGIQMLLVDLLRRRYETDEYDAPDESSFL